MNKKFEIKFKKIKLNVLQRILKITLNSKNKLNKSSQNIFKRITKCMLIHILQFSMVRIYKLRKELDLKNIETTDLDINDIKKN